MRRTFILMMSLTLAPMGAFSAVAIAESPLVQLNVYPADVNLTTSSDRQLVIVQAVQADGITRPT